MRAHHRTPRNDTNRPDASRTAGNGNASWSTHTGHRPSLPAVAGSNLVEHTPHLTAPGKPGAYAWTCQNLSTSRGRQRAGLPSAKT
jgi:hypothetical protein